MTSDPVPMVVLRSVEVEGRGLADVTLADGRIAEISPTGSARHAGRRDAAVIDIDGAGGALIPGLWDHHIHLFALAATARSVPVGPVDVRGADDLARVLRQARDGRDPGAWIRGIGYHESVAGSLDRHAIDRLVADTPVRLQHRSGAAWFCNSMAVDLLGLADADDPGVERNHAGEPTGRIFGGDALLRSATGGAGPPDLTSTMHELLATGLVGVTDATPSADPDELDHLAAAVTAAGRSLRVRATGGPALSGLQPTPPLERGPVKIVLADHRLPSVDAVAEAIHDAHRVGRRVAIHTVTRASLALCIAAFDDAGAEDQDRLEHAAVVPPELRDRIADLGLTVVTQPSFVAERGDDYLRDVEVEDVPFLYPCASLLDAGIPVAGSSDAPYGDPDPWKGMRAARDRTTRTGRHVGPAERVQTRKALGMYLGDPARPGGPERSVDVGEPADLCLLHSPLAAALTDLDASVVRTTIIGGSIRYG